MESGVGSGELGGASPPDGRSPAAEVSSEAGVSSQALMALIIERKRA